MVKYISNQICNLSRTFLPILVCKKSIYNKKIPSSYFGGSDEGKGKEKHIL